MNLLKEIIAFIELQESDGSLNETASIKLQESNLKFDEIFQRDASMESFAEVGSLDPRDENAKGNERSFI